MSKEKQDMTFTIETNISQRKFGDTYKNFIVESTQDIPVIEAFCTKVLSPAISKIEHDALPKDGDDNFGNHFAPYYTELKTLNKVGLLEDGKNKVSYKYVRPSCS